MLLELLRPKFQSLIPNSAIVVVGYSGGPDSTCLLHLLREAGVEVIAAHLHHGMRPEADQEAKLCEAFAQELDVPFVLGKADVPLIAKNMKVGLEEAGRYARYEFFEQTRRAANASFIATGHTQNDLAETVLLNMTRGCGLRGAAGIPEQRDQIIRPLLEVTREQTQAYCREHSFWTHDDPANTDETLSRVKVRNQVVPLLQTINEEAVGALARFAKIAREEDSFLDSIAVNQLEALEVPLNGALSFLTRQDEFGLGKHELLHHHHALQLRILRLLCEVLGGEPSLDALESLCEQLAAPSGGVTLPGPVQATWNDHTLILTRQSTREEFRQPLETPGLTEASAFGWAIDVNSADPREHRRPLHSLDVVLDTALIRGNLHVRNAQPGDAMVPLGMTGTKKLTDLLSEAKLTPLARERLPIVCDMVGPIWVPSLALADRVKVSAETSDGTSVSLRAL